MLLVLFLQATPSQSAPYAIYATLTVGVLSLIASGLNIYFSSKTAQKVVNLSTKTTGEVAELSAQVSRESASLSARTSQELKAIEYKNDFYKRLIERRLKAWEKSEELILSLSYTNTYKGKVIQAFFINGQAFDALLEKIRSMVMQSFWLGKEYSATMKIFYDDLLAIRSQCMEPGKLLPDGIPAVNDDLLRNAGVTNFDICSAYYGKLIRISSEQLRNLHDIEGFFSQLLDVTASA
jgi:hypothetical protein